MSFTISSTWYQDFFTELPNEFWRQAMPPEATGADIDFTERHLELRPDARVLDVPCGSGRHALELAARGHRVTGLDISDEAVAHGRRAAEAAGLDVDLRVADLRDLPQDSSYDAAVCLGNSFGYLDLAGTRAFVEALAGSLRPGGGLVIDSSTAAETMLPHYQGGSQTMSVGDITMEARREYDVLRSRAFSHYRFSRGDEAVDVTAVHYVLTCAQIAALLTEAGFVELEFFGGPDDTQYEVGSGRLLVTARRS
ncbi:hypothetical protein GCM10009789_48760 [Kribbella sancticallisti]|uniref:Methyltransferase domain-containing protein n=1 Tax=Kribbella sancticallisti TaxID=460087 RepID=A0ABP4PSI4_9ACTN